MIGLVVLCYEISYLHTAFFHSIKVTSFFKRIFAQNFAGGEKARKIFIFFSFSSILQSMAFENYWPSLDNKWPCIFFKILHFYVKGRQKTRKIKTWFPLSFLKSKKNLFMKCFEFYFTIENDDDDPVNIFALLLE